MSGVTYDYMEQYLRGLIPSNNIIMKNLENFALENRVPIVQKETAKFLELMVTMMIGKTNLILTSLGHLNQKLFIRSPYLEIVKMFIFM